MRGKETNSCRPSINTEGTGRGVRGKGKTAWCILHSAYRLYSHWNDTSSSLDIYGLQYMQVLEVQTCDRVQITFTCTGKRRVSIFHHLHCHECPSIHGLWSSVLPSSKPSKPDLGRQQWTPPSKVIPYPSSMLTSKISSCSRTPPTVYLSVMLKIFHTYAIFWACSESFHGTKFKTIRFGFVGRCTCWIYRHAQKCFHGAKFKLNCLNFIEDARVPTPDISAYIQERDKGACGTKP